MTMQDARVNTFVSVIGMTLATLMTAAIIWSAKATVELENEMVGVQRDIATLLARPPSVPWEDYNRDEQRRDMDISNLKDEIRRLPHK
jgi:type IV secretory pathway TrbF-like protein